MCEKHYIGEFDMPEDMENAIAALEVAVKRNGYASAYVDISRAQASHVHLFKDAGSDLEEKLIEPHGDGWREFEWVDSDE
jgi:hypothetical protein